MSIDQDSVKRFWDERAARYVELPIESLANLEQDADNLALKIRLETNKVFEYLPNLTGKAVLDLGAGAGQWAFRFCERGAQVTAVEYSEQFAKVGEREAQRRGHDSVRFIISPAEDYDSDQKFDVVFISGLLIYLNDDQLIQLVGKLSEFCKPGAKIILRDGTGVGSRYELNASYSEHLQAAYSAIYRTADEYISLFDQNGLHVVRHDHVFEDGCPLNKYPETRLRIYEFERHADASS